MPRLGRDRWWTKLLYSWPMVALLLLVVVWLGRSMWGVYERYSLAQAARQELKANLAESMTHRDELTEEISFLETERGLEERLRTSLPVAKAGEGVVVVVPASTSVAAVAISQTWWQRIVNFLARLK